MKVIALLLSLAAVASAGGVVRDMLGGNTGSNCDQSLQTYNVNKFVVTPWPPSKNEWLNLSMNGTMTAPVTLKGMGIFVTFNGLNFYQETIPEDGSYNAGQYYALAFKAYLPSIAPNGKYGVDVKMVSTTGAFLNCWGVTFTLS
ncbi:unnamed protein product [Blepharisma stoltei]|uniref:MD-2-related lipid-recognition domain-containing protein n=1 Tax=Blepharisma stoltei TaxID=1481888 RepID=A0AAU9K9X9_9CILI|nr:unnamed protein product [Blepharisma stoltei]